MGLAQAAGGGTATYFVHHDDLVAAIVIAVTYLILWISAGIPLVRRERRRQRRLKDPSCPSGAVEEPLSAP